MAPLPKQNEEEKAGYECMRNAKIAVGIRDDGHNIGTRQERRSEEMVGGG
jgi:hypothetical protein